MSTFVDLQFLSAQKSATKPPPLPPKTSFTLWVIANPFVQTIAHFIVALGIATVDFILCYFVIEPNFPGFFPVSSFVVDICFLAVLVLSVRVVIDREAYKTAALQHFSSFCAASQSLVTQAVQEDKNLVANLPILYLLCLRFKATNKWEISDVPAANSAIVSSNTMVGDARMLDTAKKLKEKGIDFSKHLEIYQQAAVGESFYLSRSLNGFIWACVWIYALLVPFVLWGLYDGWLAYVGLLSTWIALALAHGFTRSIHLYDVYRRHDATPFDLMEYASQQYQTMIMA